MNKTISFSPSVIACSIFDYEPFNEVLLNLSTKYVGKQYIDNTQDAERMLNGYLVQNLSLSYTLTTKAVKKFVFQLMVNNLLNHKYESYAWVYKYIEGGAQKVMDGYFPQAGINFIFKAGLTF
jgi:iron complex outermembrane receptor protein